MAQLSFKPIILFTGTSGILNMKLNSFSQGKENHVEVNGKKILYPYRSSKTNFILKEGLLTNAFSFWGP